MKVDREDDERSSSATGSTKIKVHPNSEDGYSVWEEYKDAGRVCKKHSRLPLTTPVHADKIRFVCLSDTHSKLEEIVDRIPPGDLLIHAGDFTNYGGLDEVNRFNQTLAKLPHKRKIVIAGNHELGFDEAETCKGKRSNEFRQYGVTSPQQLLTNCVYLEDNETIAYGYRIYGSPWHPMPCWAFSLPRGQPLLNKWNKIPDGIDVLVTHTPPVGHGDLANWQVCNGYLAGCVELLNTVELRVKPKYHVFGHVHPMHGTTTNGHTVFVNASICDRANRPSQPPIIFDLPLKPSYSK